MKILQVNCVYAAGSTGVLTKQLHEGLQAAGHESLVVYGRGKTVKEPGVLRLCPEWYGKLQSLLSRFTGLRYGGCLLSTLKLQKIIRKEKPDVVHLQCINGNFVNIFKLVAWLNRHRIKTVVSLHAEFMYTANCAYAMECEQWKQGCKCCPNRKKASKSLLLDRTGVAWKKMRNAFAGFETCIICPVSDWTEARAKQSDIMKDLPFSTVYNGVDAAFCYQEAIPDNKTVFHVTSHFSGEAGNIKGGSFLLALAERMPQIRFLVAGRATDLENLPKNVTLLGKVSSREQLADLYRGAGLTLLVSKKETFSMPTAESLCCGTPVVGFQAGAPEQIALPAYSEFVEYGDLDALEAAVKAWLAKDLDRRQIAHSAAKAYSSQTMVERFIQVYQ